jgi:hypothetical protein
MLNVLHTLKPAGHSTPAALQPRGNHPLIAHTIAIGHRARKIIRMKTRRLNVALRQSDLAFENPAAFPQFLLAAMICATALVLLITALTGVIDAIYGASWARVIRPLAG